GPLRLQVGETDYIDRVCDRGQGQHGVRHRSVLFSDRRNQSRLRPSSGFGSDATPKDLGWRDHGVLTVAGLSKRRFVQLAGLSIADRILPRWLRAQPTAPRPGNNVIVVTFGGGVRYSETFAPEGQRNIPRLVSLRPEGYFFENCINSGVLSHFN